MDFLLDRRFILSSQLNSCADGGSGSVGSECSVRGTAKDRVTPRGELERSSQTMTMRRHTKYPRAISNETETRARARADGANMFVGSFVLFAGHGMQAMKCNTSPPRRVERREESVAATESESETPL